MLIKQIPAIAGLGLLYGGAPLLAPSISPSPRQNRGSDPKMNQTRKKNWAIFLPENTTPFFAGNQIPKKYFCKKVGGFLGRG